MKLEFSQQILEKFSNIQIHKNASCGSSVVPYGRTDLIVAIRNFANTPKEERKEYIVKILVQLRRDRQARCSVGPSTLVNR